MAQNECLLDGALQRVRFREIAVSLSLPSSYCCSQATNLWRGLCRISVQIGLFARSTRQEVPPGPGFGDMHVISQTCFRQ